MVAVCANDDTTHDCAKGPPAFAVAVRDASAGRLAVDARPGTGPRPESGAAGAARDGWCAPAPTHVLFASGDAGCAGPCHSGARRASGSLDDAAVHALESRGDRRRDSAAGAAGARPKFWRHFRDGGGYSLTLDPSES